MSGLRVGVDATAAVALDEHDRIRAVRHGDTPARMLEQLLTRDIEAAVIDRVVAILPDPEPAELKAGARVAVLRIGAPATTAIPPLAAWPARELAMLAGPVTVVRGGHEYDGRVSAPLDLAAVTEFAHGCAGIAGAVAVAGVHGLEYPEHERLAAALLAEQLSVPVIRGGETEALGLLERENTAVLDAAMTAAVDARIGELTAVLSARQPNAELFVLRGDGTVLPAHRARRHATALIGAARAAALHGAVRLAGTASAVVVEARSDAAVVGRVRGGLLPGAGRLREIAGIRTGVRTPRPVVVSRRQAGFPDRFGAALARMRAGHDELPVVVLGDLADEIAGVPVIRPPDGELAAVLGAATAEAAGSVDRIFWQGAGDRQESANRARRLARDAAVRAGADPRTLRETPVRAALTTYVPVPAARLQVTAIGALLQPAPVTP
ncbi:hydantoinase/oxoprolinase N-terminal domain-containing protein [Sciscionella marina]|uniref:hydantoinase/oxoprolinase N-terminal domain-containing protein n=1 Tax=Sciscionella marina TaxID=508770 RepID=UPI0003769B18|nr:hydantoinase/oxoprolinase N-terminal domain-containing protein [Sciscionella marina]